MSVVDDLALSCGYKTELIAVPVLNTREHFVMSLTSALYDILWQTTLYWLCMCSQHSPAKLWHTAPDHSKYIDQASRAFSVACLLCVLFWRVCQEALDLVALNVWTRHWPQQEARWAR